MSTRFRKIVTIVAALATVVANVFVSYKASGFVYLHFFFRGRDLRDLTPGDGLGMMELWVIMLLFGWLGLFLIWGAVYRRIPKA